MSLEISVVIPVYNAGPFVRKAVESALEQPEVAEVLLIEDGSPDDSLQVCTQIAADYREIRLLTHAGNSNLGAGPTRNVGIWNARFDYIAFLDADDYYLPDRFRAERRIFSNDPDADGVYGALGFDYITETGLIRYGAMGYSDLTTVTRIINPERLFDYMMGLEEYVGGVSLDALTVKRHLIKKVGDFAPLGLHEDSQFILRLAMKGRLVPGVLDEPVGMRGVHDSNRIVRNSRRSDSYVRMYESLLTWAIENESKPEHVAMIEARLKLARLRRLPLLLRPLLLGKECVRHPSYLRWRNFRGEAFRTLIPETARIIKRRVMGRE